MRRVGSKGVDFPENITKLSEFVCHVYELVYSFLSKKHVSKSKLIDKNNKNNKTGGKHVFITY